MDAHRLLVRITFILEKNIWEMESMNESLSLLMGSRWKFYIREISFRVLQHFSGLPSSWHFLAKVSSSFVTVTQWYFNIFFLFKMEIEVILFFSLSLLHFIPFLYILEISSAYIHYDKMIKVCKIPNSDKFHEAEWPDLGQAFSACTVKGWSWCACLCATSENPLQRDYGNQVLLIL